MPDYQPRIPVKIRTARKEHACGHYVCQLPIFPGERYEIYSAPPWSDGNESPRWVTSKAHVGAYSSSGTGCDEAAAYAEKQRREMNDGIKS